MRKILSKNPFTGKIHQEFDFISNAELDKKIQRAEEGFKLQTKRSIKERAEMIYHLGQVIDRRANKLAELITMEMGKPFAQSLGEVKKVVAFCNYYSKNQEPIFPHQVKSNAKKKTLIKYKPLGVIHFIVPFNFPFFLNFKGGLPNLLLGNTMLTRNSDSNPLLGLAIEELMNDAGYDSGEYQNVFTSHEQLDYILSHNSVGGVSFTGSSRAGAIIASKAGQHLKKSVMELGGNDPFVVLKDANLQKAVEGATMGRSRNAGQICFAPKRFIVAKEHYDSFKQKLIENLEKIKYGDPMDSNTEVGPLAREDIYNNLQEHIKSIPSSWKIVWKRENVERPFFPMTVIEGTDEEYNHEMFGPVFSLFKAENEDHAVKLANAGTYGLAASVWSEKKGEEVIDKIRCGMSFVNECPSSDTTFPTGGVGRSGFGRQCGSEGYKEFANINTFYVS